MLQYVYFNITTLLMVQMCLFYAIEKKWFQNMYQCVPSVSHNVLDSPQLLFVNKYQQNIFYISQSYACIYFRFSSLIYHKIIISYTLNF